MEKEIIAYSFNAAEGSTLAELKGDLTIQNAQLIKESLLKAAKEGSRLIIDHSAAEGFDLSYMQILISLIKYSDKNKKQLEIKNSGDEKFLIVLKYSGFSGTSFFNKVMGA